MSFFGRAANLLKGGIKSIGRPDREASLKERALEEELARLESKRPSTTPLPPSAPPAPPAPEVPDRGPPERDANGDVKRTL